MLRPSILTCHQSSIPKLLERLQYFCYWINSDQGPVSLWRWNYCSEDIGANLLDGPHCETSISIICLGSCVVESTFSCHLCQLEDLMRIRNGRFSFSCSHTFWMVFGVVGSGKFGLRLYVLCSRLSLQSNNTFSLSEIRRELKFRSTSSDFVKGQSAACLVCATGKGEGGSVTKAFQGVSTTWQWVQHDWANRRWSGRDLTVEVFSWASVFHEVTMREVIKGRHLIGGHNVAPHLGLGVPQVENSQWQICMNSLFVTMEACAIMCIKIFM